MVCADCAGVSDHAAMDQWTRIYRRSRVLEWSFKFRAFVAQISKYYTAWIFAVRCIAGDSCRLQELRPATIGPQHPYFSDLRYLRQPLGLHAVRLFCAEPHISRLHI